MKLKDFLEVVYEDVHWYEDWYEDAHVDLATLGIVLM